MMIKTLILYSTTDGQTQSICTYLQKTLESATSTSVMVNINEANALDLTSFDKIVIGASIRYGKHSEEVSQFIHETHALLSNKPSAFFSVNLVARKPEKSSVDTNPYIKKFLKNITWQPNITEVFAGKVDYQKYNFFDRAMIRFIMWMTKGPTDPKACIEFTNWEKVDSFAQAIKSL